MAYINFSEVFLEFPDYGHSSKSLKRALVEIGTGGIFNTNKAGISVVTALSDVSFKLSEGDSVGIIGHNGAGKTTLLRTMAGLYEPTRGKVDISGTLATIIELGAGLDPLLSGSENILRLGLLHGLSKSEILASMQSIEEFTELGNFIYSPVSTYSSGMLMRLMFAVGTIKMPDILIVDEMFSTGDASFQRKAEQRMETLIDGSKVFVFASHSHELIKKYCNRLFLLSHGTVEEVAISSI